jgi:U3 small nucleolar RNA-associated protein 21
VSPTAIPFTSVRLGKTTFQVTTSVGRSLQTHDLRRGLNLIFLSHPQTPEFITATCAWKDRVFAAWGRLRSSGPGGVWVFKRGKKVAELDVPPGILEPIVQLLVFGSWIAGCGGRTIQVWKSHSYEHYTTLNVANGSYPGEHVFTGIVCTMPTYLNKIFVGKYDGSVDIWNLSTSKLLYSILPPHLNTGAVSALRSTPVLCLLAIAYSNGTLTIHNVDLDRPVLSLGSASVSGRTVTSIAFRSDDLGAGEDGREPGVMATASLNSGDITMWDLTGGGRIVGIIRGAHEMSIVDNESGINKVEFLDGQPLMVSSGKDNALRSWIFDDIPFSPIPRLLHSRSGHSAAVTLLKFLPASSDGSESTGKWLLSASKDHSLWGFSLRRDGQATELSQGNVRNKAKKIGTRHSRVEESIKVEDLKAPDITCIACSLNNDRGMGATSTGPIWANLRGTNVDGVVGLESVVTGHRGDKYARTWFWGKKRAGRWAFETGDGTEVKSVAISPCGTFALIGSAGGCIDMFNLQSGIHRRSFPARISALQVKNRRLRKGNQMLGADQNGGSEIGDGKHMKEVTGLMVDGLNRNVVSCGLDGRVKFWDFLSGQLAGELNWNPVAAITGLRYNSANELAAFSCDDLCIRIVDIETRKVVREFWGCVGQINDFAFSNDGRWIIVASMDSVIRAWDLSTGHLIDAFRVASTCIALDFSVTGEFLATAHADGVGINIWNNKTIFSHGSQKSINENDITEVSVPTASGENCTGTIEAAFSDELKAPEQERLPLTSEQLSDSLATLSVVPRSTWQTLLNLDLIRERNKPKEPPKIPEKAPFFIPAVSEPNGPGSPADHVSQHGLGATDISTAKHSRILRKQLSEGVSAHRSLLCSLLKSSSEADNFTPCIEYLKSLSPAKADLEIRSLDVRLQEGRCELADFVTALTERLKSKKDFELVNVWMAVFLRLHADVISGYWAVESGEYHALQMLHDALTLWKIEQQRETKRLAELVGYCRGVVSFLRSAR